jgi:hypothetical protein
LSWGKGAWCVSRQSAPFNPLPSTRPTAPAPLGATAARMRERGFSSGSFFGLCVEWGFCCVWVLLLFLCAVSRRRPLIQRPRKPSSLPVQVALPAGKRERHRQIVVVRLAAHVGLERWQCVRGVGVCVVLPSGRVCAAARDGGAARAQPSAPRGGAATNQSAVTSPHHV